MLMSTTSGLVVEIGLNSFPGARIDFLRTRVNAVSSCYFSVNALSLRSCWCQSEVQEDEVHQDELGVWEEEDVDWGCSSAKYSAQ